MPTMDSTSNFRDRYSLYFNETIVPLQDAAKPILRRWASSEYWEERHRGSVSPVIPTPVQRTYDRIKRAESILDKLAANQVRIDDIQDSHFFEMHDIFGARLVVYVESHIPLVDNAIRESGDFEMHPTIKPKWYLPQELRDRLGLSSDFFQGEERKQSGYASVHYILRPTDHEGDAWFELQVRTMLFDAWGELEHKMIYKPKISPEFNTTQHLRILADQLMALEEHFDLLYSRITYLQENAEPLAADVIDDTSLPAICSSLQLSISQKSVTKLLQILYSQGIVTVEDFNRRLSPKGLSAMRALMTSRGKALTAFHAISVAARIEPGATEEVYQQTLSEQLELVNVSELRMKQQ